MASATTLLALRSAVTREVRDGDVEEKLVEAGRIELPSEETNDKRHSCFSRYHLCLVAAT